MDFQREHEAFIQSHQEKRTGERLRRLQEGHGHAEKLFLQNIWWGAVGHFRNLYPEYEVKDFQDGTRYVDFAYLRPPYRICFEIDGYGPHARDVDRWRFGDNLMRQNQLMLDDWKVFRFSFDDITQKQRRCQQIILHIMGRWFGEQVQPISLTHREKEIAHMAAIAVEPLKPKLVATRLGIRVEHARRWLHRLHEKGILRPASGDQRIRSYVLDTAGKQIFF
ncbi:DNA-binding response regulator [Paenibacillus sp. GCM10027628]|uniref:DNA-binding response regulator n=1 Tax=Paenibacillus sp. GCM10027628 TaxID=3273413 RepID=UPI0036388592